MPSYYIAYERDGKQGYVASAPALPGCVVYGKTLQEAYRNIQTAIQECLEVIYERIHHRAIDEIIEDINDGKTPPSLNHRPTSMKK